MSFQTQAMIISTQHLFAPRASLEGASAQGQEAPPSGQQTPAVVVSTSDLPSETPAPAKSDVTSASDTPIEGETTSKAPTPPLPSSTIGADEAVPETAAPSPGTGEAAGTGPGGVHLDIAFEASKLPMDVAIFNSARAAGGDEKIRKYLQAVLVVGGTALVPGISHALESRYVLLHVLIIDFLMHPCRQVAGHRDAVGSEYGQSANYPPSEGRRSACACVEGRRGTWENGWGLRFMVDGQRLGKLRKLNHAFNALALTLASRTSWGYAGFANDVSTYNSLLFGRTAVY